MKGQFAEMKRRSLFVSALVLFLLPVSGCKPSPESLRASLLTAVKTDNTADARKLIGKGADANSHDSPGGWSALHYAARNGNVEIVQLLLSAGADPNYVGTKNGQSGTVISLKPLIVAESSLQLVRFPPPYGFRSETPEDAALVKSMQDPNAADRYQKVIDILTKAASTN